MEDGQDQCVVAVITGDHGVKFAQRPFLCKKRWAQNDHDEARLRECRVDRSPQAVSKAQLEIVQPDPEARRVSEETRQGRCFFIVLEV